jgi:hypothetical protein
MLEIDRSFHAVVETLYFEMTWGGFEQQYPDVNLMLDVVVEQIEQKFENDPHDYLVSDVVGIKITINDESHTYYLDDPNHIPQLNWREGERPATITLKTTPMIRRKCG